MVNVLEKLSPEGYQDSSKIIRALTSLAREAFAAKKARCVNPWR
jgi:hypothetical protein